MRRALVVGVLVVAAACGGGGDDDDVAEDDLPATTTTVAEAEAEGSTTTAAVAASTTTAATGDGPATTVAASGGAAAPQEVAGPAPLAPGTYHYRQTGEIKAGPQTYPFPPEGTAEVEPADADGTQLVRRFIDPEQPPIETRIRFDRAGILLVETSGGGGPTGFRCTFDPPLTLVAWPPTVGHTASGEADCENVHITYEVRITGQVPVTIDGATYEAFVMESTVTTTGDLESTSEQLDHFVAELRQSVHTESTSEGTFRGVQFSATSTSDLVSATPD